jgi:hypothetical protein
MPSAAVFAAVFTAMSTALLSLSASVTFTVPVPLTAPVLMMRAFRFDLLFAALPAPVEVLAAPLPFLFMLLSGAFRACVMPRLDLRLMFNFLLFNTLLRLGLHGRLRTGLRERACAEQKKPHEDCCGYECSYHDLFLLGWIISGRDVPSLSCR